MKKLGFHLELSVSQTIFIDILIDKNLTKNVWGTITCRHIIYFITNAIILGIDKNPKQHVMLSMISIKSKQRNTVAQIKQIRRVNGNICQHTWSIYWIEHGQHLLFETLFAVIDNDIVLQECLGVTLDFDFCTKWDSQLSLLETFIATINGRTPLPAQISASNFHDLVPRVISNFSVRFEPNLKSHLSAGWCLRLTPWPPRPECALTQSAQKKAQSARFFSVRL